MSETPSEAELVVLIEKNINKIKAYRIESFPPIVAKLGKRIVHLAAIWRSALAYRLVDLAEGSLAMFNEGRLVPGCTLSRSALETLAGVHLLKKRTSKIGNRRELEAVLDFLMCASFGSRDSSSNYDALNVLTMIDHLDKGYSGILRAEYDHLSEFAHPNLKGGLMAYSDIDNKTLGASLGINPGKLPVGAFGLGGLDIVLEVGVDEFEQMQRNLENFEGSVYLQSVGVFIE